MSFILFGCRTNNKKSDDESFYVDPVGVPETPQLMTSKTALQYFIDEDIKMGWNLGNTMDALDHNTKIADETAWGNPLMSQNFINALASHGVDIVRITCTWTGHIGSAPDYKVSVSRLNRVAEIVNMVHAAGMKAIINIHHDGNYTQPPNTWGFLKFAETMSGRANNIEIKNQITAVWTQIASYFENYGDNLIFETLNEIHSGNWGNNVTRAEQERLFEWNQTALNAIRATGGNNATRFVAVPGLGSTEPPTVIAAHNLGLLLPDDGINETDKLIVSVHFYHPWRFTVAEATGQTGSNLIHTITQSELNDIDIKAKSIYDTFISKGIAVYYGEWGAPTTTRANMSREIQERHVDYIRRVASACRANGIVPIIWDDGGNFRVLQRSNGQPAAGLWTDVLNVYKNAISDTKSPFTN